MDAARSGDWDAAERAATALSEQPVPDGRDALRGHLRDLREALIVARACRAGLYQSANRLAAAARDLLFDGTGDIHNVALLSQRAALSVELFQQVRNKFVSAYQEIMKMPM